MYQSGLKFPQSDIVRSLVDQSGVSIPYQSGLKFPLLLWLMKERVYMMSQSRINPVSSFHLRFPNLNTSRKKGCLNPVSIRSQVSTRFIKQKSRL